MAAVQAPKFESCAIFKGIVRHFQGNRALQPLAKP
jgi:hypothetical protein